MLEVLPSLLAADFARLGDEIARVEQAGATMLHVDIMDGHFVPNLTMGPPVVKSIRKVTQARLDVHLMINDPDRYAPLFIEAGANLVSVHQEVCRHLDRTVQMIQQEGALAGVVINPATPVAALEDALEFVDYVLVMSVNPGFGGQEFLPHTLRKVTALQRLRRERGLSFAIEIDGGIAPDTVADAVRAGAEWLVAGSAVFQSSKDKDAGAAFGHLRQLAHEATSVHV